MRLLALKTILVATDLDEGSRAALTTARELAIGAGANVHVLHVSAEPDAVQGVTAMLDDAGLSADIHIGRGSAAQEINLLSRKIGANAILLGAHRGPHDPTDARKLGGTALAVVTDAAAPCMVVSRPLAVPLRYVLAAIDVSESARGTLEVALSWTSALRAPAGPAPTTLSVLHVHPPLDHSNPEKDRRQKLLEILNTVEEEAGSWSGASIETAETENADVSAGIVEYARTRAADLVVLGTRGIGPERVRRLGSVSAAVMRRLDTPVLLVPPSMWAGD